MRVSLGRKNFHIKALPVRVTRPLGDLSCCLVPRNILGRAGREENWNEKKNKKEERRSQKRAREGKA